MVGGLFLEVGHAVAREYEGKVACNDLIVDNAAMQLVLKPEQFDVIVTTNLFGDILSDLISGLVGGLGLTPGANIGTNAAIFEAVHGSAPDIAGQGIANPSAHMLAAAMMLDHVKEHQAAGRLRDAIRRTIVDDGIRTRDLGGSARQPPSAMRSLGGLQAGVPVRRHGGSGPPWVSAVRLPRRAQPSCNFVKRRWSRTVLGSGFPRGRMPGCG
jgi:isocitrate/isopropylmalate dehydrogenase